MHRELIKRHGRGNVVAKPFGPDMQRELCPILQRLQTKASLRYVNHQSPPEYAARYRSLYYASQNRSGALKRANNAINEEIEEGKTKQPRY